MSTNLAACIDDLSVANVHKIVVASSRSQVKVLALLILLLLEHFAHVLYDKLTGTDGHLGKEPIALGTGSALFE